MHRIQRVPITEKKGRRHSSLVTVSYISDTQASPVALNLQEVEISTFKASGPGGQNRNKRETGIRAVHLPTGITVTNADQRSQLQNKNLALEELERRVKDEVASFHHAEVNAQRVNEIESRSFSWTEWRDEVKASTGHKASYKQALKGRLRNLLK